MNGQPQTTEEWQDEADRLKAKLAALKERRAYEAELKQYKASKSILNGLGKRVGPLISRLMKGSRQVRS